MKPAQPRDCDGRRGSALVEFAVTAPLLILLAVGTAFAGASFDRYLALQQLVRAAANMHSSGTDFSLPEKQALLEAAAAGLDLSASGDTVLYLSTVADTPDGPRLVRRFAVGAAGVGASLLSAAEGQYDGAVIPPAPARIDFDLVPGQRVYVVEAVHDLRGLAPPGTLSEDYRLRTRAVF